MLPYEKEFLFSLLLTVIAETIVVLIFVRFIYKKSNINISKTIFTSIIASALTLPYLWFILPFFVFNRIVYIGLGESLVVLIEALIYFQFLSIKFSKAFIVSFFANLISVLIGLLVF
jgi:hypothetical protein